MSAAPTAEEMAAVVAALATRRPVEDRPPRQSAYEAWRRARRAALRRRA